ncbi:hypothetical protein, partial [Rhodococcus zopfii]|uniref:hypothetical protein n=1 Tax=Rhodococcus zopfii TaxID=43772 RepID=UPI001EDCDF71
LDMRRYHLLLAGASWMAEYGDPDNPDEWAFLKKYSPYQNVDPVSAGPFDGRSARRALRVADQGPARRIDPRRRGNSLLPALS